MTGWHAAAEHWPPTQLCSHAPQLFSSTIGSMQEPLHGIRPPSHVMPVSGLLPPVELDAPLDELLAEPDPLDVAASFPPLLELEPPLDELRPLPPPDPDPLLVEASFPPLLDELLPLLPLDEPPTAVASSPLPASPP